MNLEIIFAEFGSRSNSNQPTFDKKFRLDPTYSSVKEYFPEAKITLYTDRKEIGEVYPDVELNVVDGNLFDKSHHKWGGFCCDYYEIKGDKGSALVALIPEEVTISWRERITILDGIILLPSNKSCNILGSLESCK